MFQDDEKGAARLSIMKKVAAADSAAQILQSNVARTLSTYLFVCVCPRPLPRWDALRGSDLVPDTSTERHDADPIARVPMPNVGKDVKYVPVCPRPFPRGDALRSLDIVQDTSTERHDADPIARVPRPNIGPNGDRRTLGYTPGCQ